MVTRRRYVVATAVVLTSLLAGRVGSLPLAASETASAAEWRGAPESLAATSDSPSPTRWSDLQVKRPSKFRAALKRAAQRFSHALAISPKVVPAEDPVSLSSDPGPIGADLHLKAGQLYESQGDDRGAADQYEKALEIDPNDVATLVSFARLRNRQNRFPEAVALYQRAIEADPNNATSFNDLGLCLARQGDPQQSMEALRRAIELQPESKLYRNNIAAVLVNVGRGEEALAHLSAVYPPAIAQYNTGVLLYRSGQPALAAGHFAQAVQHDPTLAAAQRMLARLETHSPRSAAARPSGSPNRMASASPRSPHPAPGPAHEASRNATLRFLPPVVDLGP